MVGLLGARAPSPAPRHWRQHDGDRNALRRSLRAGDAPPVTGSRFALIAGGGRAPSEKGASRSKVHQYCKLRGLILAGTDPL